MIEDLSTRILHHIEAIYGQKNADTLTQEIITSFFPDDSVIKTKETHLPQDPDLWSEKTSILITYGNTLIEKKTPTLKTLHKFLDKRLENKINCVHILPFFPYSSDEGFAIIDYKKVRKELGTWDDIKKITNEYHVMSDIVINHASSKNVWFKKYLGGVEKYKNYFFTANPDDDISKVVRPRPSPLLTCFDAHEGLKYVWCTFGPDQVDFNFANPRVLIEFVKLIRLYIDYGIRIFRLDAIAFLWKEVGTECIHLPQTHEIIRLFRTLIDFYAGDVLIITETNVPNEENLTYFGNQNEAHMIYNFSLPPILLHALLSGDSSHIKKWLLSLPTPQNGCTYLNFTASHDGIGLRPIKGLLDDNKVDEMIETMRDFGGEISMRAVNGSEEPYEINIALIDAFKGTLKGEDEFQIQRFLTSQIIMMSLQGIPAFYIHSLLGTPNAYKRYQKSGHKRCINRRRWDYPELEDALDDPTSTHHIVFEELKRVIDIRKKQKAFHPESDQFILNLPDGFLGFWRQSKDKTQNILCITNITNKNLTLPLHDIHMEVKKNYIDLLTGNEIKNHEEPLTLSPYQTIWITD
jgi:sucrose phosphorylase